jgi:pimeloyl-ACP methyl ester carboxylesterase
VHTGKDAAIRHEFIEAGGMRFHVATCGEGDHLALCLHGFPECWYSWRHQMPLLARLGYRVWAPDLRGYGESSKPRGIQNYSVEALMADVGALIDVSGAKSVTLLGHDWGGIIAWFCAIRAVRPLDRLVVMNAPHPFAAAPVFRTWQQRRKSWYALFFQLPWIPEWLFGARGCRAVGEAMRSTSVHPERFPDEALAVFRNAASEPGALTGMLNYYRAFVRGGGWKRQRELGAGIIATPTLLIWGEQDVALSLETTVGTEAWVENFTAEFLPDASHWVQQDVPDAVDAILTAWLPAQTLREAPMPPSHSSDRRSP